MDSAAPHAARRRVLLVDDDLDILEALELALSPTFDVAIAHDASEALERIDAGRFDVMILDLMMPGMAAGELLRELARRGVGMPVLAASARHDIAQRCAELGLANWIQKPFRLATLIDQLSALVPP